MADHYVGPRGGHRKRFPPTALQRPKTAYRKKQLAKYRAICRNCKNAGIEPPPPPKKRGLPYGWALKKYLLDGAEQGPVPVPFQPGARTSAEGRFIARDIDEAIDYLKSVRKPPRYMRDTAKKRVAMREKAAPMINKPMASPVPAADPNYKYKHWSEARDEHFFQWLTDGGLVSTWCRAANLPYHIVTYRKAKDPEFAAKYETARQLGYDAIAEEALRIADTPVYMEDTVETVLADGKVIKATKKGDNPYARKLAVWARFELLKKWAPDKYGDKVAVDLHDNRAQAIRAARTRLAPSMKGLNAADDIVDVDV